LVVIRPPEKGITGEETRVYGDGCVEEETPGRMNGRNVEDAQGSERSPEPKVIRV
jgi:hypothetical protein